MAQNFAGLIETTARRFSDRIALARDGGALTYAELDDRAGRFARALSARGVGPGDRLGVSIPNGWEFVAALLAGWKLGATVAPLNPLLSPEEKAKILADLNPALVVHQVDTSGPSGLTAGTAETPALVLYTSGTTGAPKGAVLSHAALACANQSWAGPVMALTPDDVVLGVLPLSHSFGLNGALLAPLLAGARVILIERFAPAAVLDAIERHRVTVFPGVATMFRRLLDAPDLESAKLSTLRLALSGAAPCPWELAQEWRTRTGVRILRGYGMTELFRPISYLAADPTDLVDAIGHPVPGVEIRIVDDAGHPLGDSEIGELWIKTPAVMDGYLNLPAETGEVLQDGWFRTGDLAIARNGFVGIVGRKRELVLRGGYSISPSEVEAVLLTHPAVAEAAVVGLPHPELGEEVAAFVRLRPGSRLEPEELIAYSKARLAAFKYPRRVTILPQLPRAATGKVLKSRLKT